MFIAHTITFARIAYTSHAPVSVVSRYEVGDHVGYGLRLSQITNIFG